MVVVVEVVLLADQLVAVVLWPQLVVEVAVLVQPHASQTHDLLRSLGGGLLHPQLVVSVVVLAQPHASQTDDVLRSIL